MAMSAEKWTCLALLRILLPKLITRETQYHKVLCRAFPGVLKRPMIRSPISRDGKRDAAGGTAAWRSNSARRT
jgi:hypothetical protein